MSTKWTKFWIGFDFFLGGWFVCASMVSLAEGASLRGLLFLAIGVVDFIMGIKMLGELR